MKRINKIPTQKQSHTSSSLAIDTIDAYEMAHDVISDFSVIFEEIEERTIVDFDNKRILRMLSLAGSRHASDTLKLIDEEINRAHKILDELKTEHGVIKNRQ